MSIAALVAEHGSPLWLADVDRARERLAGLRAAWSEAWPQTEIAYSYKTNRTTAFLRAFADEGAGAEVVCAAEYALARDVIGVGGWRITVNGPAKPDALLDRCAADGALVIADSADELERLALAGVERVGLRVGLPGPEGHPSRFGIAAGEVVAAGRRARKLGLALEVLSVHLVSTDFTAAPAGTLASSVRVAWAKPPAVHARAAATLARLAIELGVGAIDLGGGLPAAAPAATTHAAITPPPTTAHAPIAARPATAHAPAPSPPVTTAHAPITSPRATAHAPIAAPPATAHAPITSPPAATAHAQAVAGALHAAGFAGRVMLEPGRALVADAVDLACTVVAVKTLADGTRCAVIDAGTDLLASALWAWPRLEALSPRPGDTPTLVAGPLCLNIDVVSPAAPLGDLAPGDVLIARDVGAYNQVQSTQFGDLRPAVLARDGGTWRLHRRREEISDLIINDREEPSWSA